MSLITQGGERAKPVSRTGRNIPNLIYAIEQYERFLLQLSKKTSIYLLRGV